MTDREEDIWCEGYRNAVEHLCLFLNEALDRKIPEPAEGTYAPPELDALYRRLCRLREMADRSPKKLEP